VSLLPLGMLAVKLAQLFEHGRVKVALVAISVAQVVANGSFLRSETLGLTIFGDGLLELILFVQDQRKVGMGFPEGSVQTNGMAISANGGREVTTGVQGDAQVVVSIGIVGLASQRLIESMHRRTILPIGEQSRGRETGRPPRSVDPC
jgi:hypothetical protein